MQTEKNQTSFERDKPGEECGIFGIMSNKNDSCLPAADTYTALFALQHRGQESCGIAVSNAGNLSVKKGLGLLTDVFDEQNIQKLTGNAAIGHVRYSTADDLEEINAQPTAVRHTNGELALAFNGKLVNSRRLRQDIEYRGGIFQTTVDSETIAYMLVRERLTSNTLEDALVRVVFELKGAYSIVILSGKKLIGVRDPNGFRPLCIGKLDDTVVFASESCALDAIGAKFERDVQPGEIVIADENGLRSIKCGNRGPSSLCVFEYIYFARPDSVIDGVSVDRARQISGCCLAKKNKHDADVVVGVPDSGLSAAMGFSTESGIPYCMGLVKNKYIGRTFILPYQVQRERSVHLKLNALRASVEGKRVILVDDSIVRGTTSAKLVKMIRNAGATEVHLRIASPPFMHPCLYGTDIAGYNDLVAHGRTIEEINEIVGSDSLDFLDLDDVRKMVTGLSFGYCDACFTGNYPATALTENAVSSGTGNFGQ